MSVPEIFQNTRLPVVAAPMFLVSGPELVLASCKAGITGTFPALNQRTTEGFREWVVDIKDELAKFAEENPDAPVGPFGVNLIVHRSNPRMRADLEVCVEQEVPLVITSLGAVTEVVDAVHSYGGVVFHDVTNRRHAQKAAEAGVDGIVLVAGGAGGHAGTTNPFALLSDIRPVFDGTIILAGALSTGRDIAAAKAMGADLAYMGTRFIATAESRGQDAYKEMICEARPEDIIHTPAVSGVPANFMRQSLEQNDFDMEKLLDPGQVDFGEKLTVSDEAKAWKTVWSAGHGVSAIDEVPSVAELVDRLEAEYLEACRELAAEVG
ncbi:nitronate monooxygenase [Persicimonas caeni]|uniref:Nitronate monooxygenase n=1 Tax=Persicimonas caeni TaxID=2292766 RepID=A0A4Y6PZV6_PERCE|nr:nitronate monooxygenase family protein [Persicimonas caeni]QDG53851.1 nitronate monooxygenase [Persicimonas caeni]QED35072.1 nitronate monooxygenase [Persicimonas caeni]